jgi:formylglycine-generating enzyme required for sulfatase activity
MNKFEAEIEKARSQHRRNYFLITATLVAGFVGVIALFMFSRGVSIQVMPEDAAKTARISIIQGVAFPISNVIYSFSGETKIAVAADGFKNKNRTIRPEESGEIVEIRLRALPGILALETTPNLEGTRWAINGVRSDIAESFREEVEAGAYEIEIDNQYFEVVKERISVGRGETVEKTFPLTKVAGELEISSSPSGASVTLDGKAAGLTPIAIPADGGAHDLSVSLEGYHDVKDRFEITNSRRDFKRNYRFLRKSATIKFDVKPRGGTLLVDGIKADPRSSHELESNVSHKVSYAADGYFAASQEVELAPNETKTLRLHLKPEFGAVSITSTPPSTVKIKGVVVAETPAKLRLPARRVKLEITKPGYRSVERSILPSSARTTQIWVTLVPEEDARLQEAPNRYKNSQGSELTLFKPSSFEMGAPRSQRGQRANEFQREIKLTKPFYASRHEITNAQYVRFKGSGTTGLDGQLPVTSVSWQEAAAYCNWLSHREKLKPFYVQNNNRLVNLDPTSNGYRLLSEAEWEWLSRRAGRPQQTIFPWGNNTTVPSRFANIADESARGAVRFYVPSFVDGFSGLAPVGSFAEEKSGLFDLTGNASEWVHDFYSLIPPQSNKIETDPLGPTAGDVHVVKGSSWRSGSRTTLRSAYREGLAGRRDDVGFRIGRYL